MSREKVDVYYQRPGDSEWRLVGSEADRRAARARVRALLAEVDEGLRRAQGRRSKEAAEALAFEQEISRAVGAWGRYAGAGFRRVVEEAEAVVEGLIRKVRRRE